MRCDQRISYAAMGNATGVAEEFDGQNTRITDKEHERGDVLAFCAWNDTIMTSSTFPASA